MNREQFQKIKALFPRVAALPVSEQPAFLAEACQGDAELERVLKEMLADRSGLAQRAQGSILRPWLEMLWKDCDPEEDQPGDSPESVPVRIGQFRIIRKIGEGGMGVVFEAQQDHPQRTVALKLLRVPFANAATLGRFRQEIDLLGRLEHPGIARIYEAGSAAIGGVTQPYFAMELVRGGTLTEFARQRRLETRNILELFVRLCEAVEYAHERGIVHRDLKPANILVDDSTDGGQPKVLDFGVSRALASQSHAMTAWTEAGQLVGTLQYMSPEQVLENPADIDVRSDVYSLGVILYQLLTGQLPYDLLERSLPEAMRQIRLREPKRVGQHCPEIRGDLETIVGKAMEKDKSRRYASAGELGADIRRFLSHHPIVARPPSAIYCFRKFTHRNRALVGGLAGIFLALFLGFVGVIAYARMASSKERAVRWGTYKSALITAHQALERDEVLTAGQALDDAPAEHRRWEWHYLKGQLKQWEAEMTAPAILSGFMGVDESRGQILAALQNSSIGIWDMAKREWLGARPTEFQVATLATNPANGQVALGTSFEPVYLWDRETDGIRLLHADAGPTRGLIFSRDGSRLLVVLPSEIALIDVASGQMLARTWATTEKAPVAMRGDAGLVAFTIEGNAILWNPATDEKRCIHKTLERYGAAAFSPDGLQIALGTHYRNVYILDIRTGEVLHTLAAHSDSVFRLVYTPDGKSLVSGSPDQTIRIWNVERGDLIRTIHTGNPEAWNPTMNPDGRTILVNTMGTSSIRVWPLERESSMVLRGHPSYAYALAQSSDGKWLAVGMGGPGGRDEVFVWRVDLARPLVVHTIRDNSSLGLAFSLDGRNLWAGSGVWNLSDGPTDARASSFDKKCELVGGRSGLRLDKGRRFSRDGRLQVVAGQTVELRSGVTHELLGALPTDRMAHAASLSPDERRMATAHDDGTVRVWNIDRLADIKETAVLKGHTDKVFCVEFSLDGRRIASGGNDNTIRIWDTDTWDTVLELLGHQAFVHDLLFSHDGKRLFSASGDKTVRIWQTAP